MNSRVGRARPSEELVRRQREAKARWRHEVARRPFREKVAMMLEMQKRLYPVLQKQRPMQSWQRPWSIDP
jgi:hypothetical protein